jgi:hypothetical protein
MQTLISIDQQLSEIFKRCPSQIFEQEDLDLLKSLKQRKNDILSIEEASWRLRSRAIWIEKGDKNTKFFHKFASQRCSHNSIWDLSDEDGNLKSTDSELKEMAFNHFKSQYSAIESENIDLQIEVLKTVPVSLMMMIMRRSTSLFRLKNYKVLSVKCPKRKVLVQMAGHRNFFIPF